MQKSSSPYVIKKDPRRVSLWPGGEPLLYDLQIELTERCNNNCIHCCINRPAEDRTALKSELDTKEIQAFLTEAASLGCMEITFTGGEPLLRDDFDQLYVFARKLGIKVRLLTNATLITPQRAKLLARIPPLEKVEITVYGMQKKSYEAVSRTPGSYAAAMRGIRLLLAEKVPFIVKGAILPPTRGEIEAFDRWAATLPQMKRPPSYAMFFQLRRRRDSQAKNRIIKDLRLSPAEAIPILARRPQEYIQGVRKFCKSFVGPPGAGLFECGAGVGGGCLNAYGQLQPCMDLRHPKCLYDLKKSSLRDALTGFFPGLRRMTAENPDYLHRCARCFLKSFCGQCPGLSWQEHGTLDTPVEYYCEITHAQAIHLGILKKDEQTWEVKDWKQRIKSFV